MGAESPRVIVHTYLAAISLSLNPVMAVIAAESHAQAALFQNATPLTAARNSAEVDAQMFEAIHEGNLAAVSSLLSQGADLTGAMFAACSAGTLAIVQLLLVRGANVNAIGLPSGTTPLLNAATAGKADIAAVLIQKGANIEARDWNGDTPLINAVYSGDLATVKVILDHGAHIKAVNRAGSTALMVAQERAKDPSRAAGSQFPQIVALLASPDCAQVNCKPADNSNLGPPQPVVVPPSTTRCDDSSPAVSGDVSYAFPASMPPLIGNSIVVSINTAVIAQVRLLAISGGKIIGMASGGAQNKTFATYPGSDFHIQPELCVKGSWKPITNALKTSLTYTIGKNGQAENDLMELAAPGETYAPTSSNVALEIDLEFPAPQVVVNVDAKHNCHNFLIVQEVTNYGEVSIAASGTPYPAKVASVRMAYSGNYNPGDNPWHDSGLPASPANPERLDSFPYGGPLTSTVYNASYAVVSDQKRSAGIGVDICGSFNVSSAVELGDGRKYYGYVHAG